MDYKQTLKYLFDHLPMYQRIGPAAYKANLDNITALCKHLDNPESKFRSIHIAGTNGKGSTAHMLAAVFAAHGYKTGLATSPHLADFRERIRINGAMIPPRYVSRFVEKHRHFFEPLNASFFEISIAMTFQYFADEHVDIAIIETGLGGRLDSTNVIVPELSVITNISYDHMKLLGNTLAEIAAEKAGIIKRNIPVVVGRKQEESMPVFSQISSMMEAPIYYADDLVQCVAQRHPDGKQNICMHYDLYVHGKRQLVELDLLGLYQRENVVTAVAALEVYKKYGSLALADDNILHGLRHAAKSSGLAGRWQQIGEQPFIVCDTAHNADGIQIVMQQLRETPHERTHIVFGMVDDKDADQVLSLLPKDASYYFCRPDVPRGLSADILQDKARHYGLQGKVFSRVRNALAEAKNNASPCDLIFVGGSTFVVAEVLRTK